MGGTDNGETLGCAVSITYQFSQPYPWSFLRQHLKSILLTPDIGALEGFAKGGLSQREVAFLDTNGDGTVTEEEVNAVKDVMKDVKALKKSIPAKVLRAARVAEDGEAPLVLREWEKQAFLKEESLAGWPKNEL